MPGDGDIELDFTLDPYETDGAPKEARPTFFKKSPLDGAIDCEVEAPAVLAWRLKERMKTMSVALVACLNIRVDPPDVIKPSRTDAPLQRVVEFCLTAAAENDSGDDARR